MSKSSAKTWVKRGLVALIGVPAAALFLVLLALQTSFIKDRIRTQVEDLASAELHGTLHIGELEGTLLGSMTLVDVRLEDEDGRLLVEADRIEAIYGLGPIARGQFVVDSLWVDGVRAAAVLGEDGVLNFAKLVDPNPDPDEPIDFLVQLNRIRMTKGTVVFIDQNRNPLESYNAPAELLKTLDLSPNTPNIASIVALDGLEFEGKATIDLNGPIEATVTSLTAQAGANHLTKGSLALDDIRFQMDAESLGASIQSLSAAGLEVSAIRFDGSASQHLTAKINVTPDALNPLLQRAGLEGTEIALLKNVAIETSVDFDANQNSAEAFLRLQTDEAGRATALVRMAELEDVMGPKFEFALQTQGLKASDVVAGIPLNSKLNLDIAGEGRGLDPMTMDADIELAVRSSEIDVYYIKRAYLKAQKRAQSIEVTEARLDSPYLIGVMQGGVDSKGGFELEMTARNPEIVTDELKRLLKSDNPPHVSADLEASGQLDLAAADDPWKLVESLKLKARWSLKNFAAEDIVVNSSDGDLDFELDAGTQQRNVRWDIDAQASRNRIKSIRARHLDIDTRGHAVLKPEELTEDWLGAIPELRTNLKLQIDDLRSPDVSVNRALVTTIVQIDKRKVAVKNLDLTAAGVRSEFVRSKAATVRGNASVRLDRKLRPTRLKVDATVATVETTIAGQSIGQLDAKVDVEGPASDLVGTANVKAAGLAVSQYDFKEVAVDLELEGKRRFVLNVDGQQNEGKVPEHVVLKMTGNHHAALDGWDIDSVHVQTKGEAWTIANGVQRRPDGTLVFDDLELTHGDQRVHVDGEFRPGKDQDLTANLEDFDIEKLAEDFGLTQLDGIRGRISGEAEVTGTAKKPESTFSLVLKDVYYQDLGPFTVSVEGAYADDMLQIHDLHLSGWGHPLLEMAGLVPVHIETTGKFEILREEETLLDIELEEIDLGEVAPNIPELAAYRLKGILSGETAFYGTLSKPFVQLDMKVGQWETTVAGDFDDTHYGPIDIGVEAHYEPPTSGRGGFEFKSSFGTSEDNDAIVRASVTGELEKWIASAIEGDTDTLISAVVDAPFQLIVVIPSLDVEALGIGQNTDARPEGIVDVFISANGTVGSPKGQLRGRLSNFGWDRYRDIFVDVGASFGDGQVDINTVTLQWDGDEIFKASGTIPMPTEELSGTVMEDLKFDLRAELLPIPISKLSAFNYTFAAAKGTIFGGLRMSGTVSDPQFLMNLGLQKTKFADRQTGTAEIAVKAKDGRLEANATLVRGEEKVINVQANVPVNLNLLELSDKSFLKMEDPIQGHVVIKPMPLAGVLPYKIFDHHLTQVKGSWEADLEFEGTLKEPTSRGELKITDASTFLPKLGRNIRDASLLARVEPGKIAIETLHLADSQGSLDMKGTVTGSLVEPDDVNLQLKLKEFGTSGFTPMPTYVTAKTTIDADVRAREVKIGVKGLEVAIPDSGQQNAFPTALHPDIRMLTPRERALGIITREDIAELKTASVSLAHVEIDIEPGWIRHPNAEIKFKGNLGVDFKGEESLVSGDIEALAGQIEVFGKQFDIERGILTFVGDSPPNPRIQADAIYKYDRSVSELLDSASSGVPRATIRVSGSALRPRLKMESDPALTETEIVYVLVTDRAPATAKSGEEEGVSSQAMAAATGLLSGMMKQRASDYYPIDMLRLESDEQGISGMEVGKYFGSDLFFAYQYQFAPDQDENQSEVRVEYKFAPRWLIGTKFGDRGNGAGFLFWTVL